MPLADLGDVKIYYEEHGNGEPIFFIPGYSSDVSWWNEVASSLKPFYRLILLDYRGGGRRVNSKPSTIRDLADDSVKVMDHLKIKKTPLLWVIGSTYFCKSLVSKEGTRCA